MQKTMNEIHIWITRTNDNHWISENLVVYLNNKLFWKLFIIFHYTDTFWWPTQTDIIWYDNNWNSLMFKVYFCVFVLSPEPRKNRLNDISLAVIFQYFVLRILKKQNTLIPLSFNVWKQLYIVVKLMNIFHRIIKYVYRYIVV